MLSAIVQKVTGEKVVDYLYPRLFRPLGIVNARWQESPQGINTGGWGLYLKTEDLAKMGQLFLQKGNWNGQQILPEEWVKEASACQVPSLPAGMKPEMLKKAKMSAKTSDWLRGLRLPDVALPPQRLPCRWCQRTIHTGVAGQGCRHCRHRQHPRHAGRAESNMEVPAARAIKRLLLINDYEKVKVTGTFSRHGCNNIITLKT